MTSAILDEKYHKLIVDTHLDYIEVWCRSNYYKHFQVVE